MNIGDIWGAKEGVVYIKDNNHRLNVQIVRDYMLVCAAQGLWPQPVADRIRISMADWGNFNTSNLTAIPEPYAKVVSHRVQGITAFESMREYASGELARCSDSTEKRLTRATLRKKFGINAKALDELLDGNFYTESWGPEKTLEVLDTMA